MSLDDHFAEPVGRIHDDDIAEAALGIDREHDPGCTLVGANHLLHPDRESDFHMVIAFISAIGDCAISEEGSHRPDRGADYVLAAAYIEVRLLLTGKGSARQVLGSGRGAHRDVGVLAVLLLHLCVRLEDCFLEILRERGLAHRVAHELATA